MAKNTVPDKEEKEILRRNGIDCDSVFVVHRSDEYIVVKNYKTGDHIMICQGDRKW